MKSLRGALLVVSVSLTLATPLRGKHPVSDLSEKNVAFDYLLFSQQSTEGYCRATGNCVTDKLRHFWTIHGLWPSNATAWPENCDPSHPFDASRISTLRSQLDEYWPSVTSENSDSFWSHEWSKHGTCAKSIPRLSGEYNYFSQTLQLYSKWNLTEYLEDAQVRPDNDRAYPVSEVEKALDNRLEAKARLECQRVHGMEFPLLKEIHFCLTKDLDVMDCPGKDENCGTDRIYYIKEA
ncbi:ribonuclease Oy [Galendromus occidentalis]|uniref:Ribonuclease Oy n=1 Tax=Galendromus occidentalis TaxID=34638 RepID=A0AAJ6QYC5_9ACAR|nr:ribonuclease Oy [Galendromus occidentalis]